MTTLRIPARFNGPPGSANGGVTCGLLARESGLAEITLRQPPPLEVDLVVRDNGLYDGELLVAQAAAGEVTVTPPDVVPLEEAREAVSRYRGHVGHPFPTCFVCGPEHPTGLHLFAGEVAPGVVACPWVPEDDDPVMVWAALDCPGAWSNDPTKQAILLGRMTTRVDRLPVRGEEHVVMGWRRGQEGRKVLTGSVLYTPGGELLAVTEQTWITVPTP